MLKEDKIDLNSIQSFLTTVDAFKELDTTVIGAIASRMSVLNFEAGEHLIWAGGLGRYLLVIKRGTIYVSLDSKDIELGEGAIVGEMALLSRKPSKADVVALKDSQALAVNYDDFQELMAEHAGLATKMSELMESRMFGKNGLNSLAHYKIIDHPEEGSTSDTYKAIDIDTGDNVSIKMLNYELTAQVGFKQQFEADMKVISQLKHPNILQVKEAIDDYSTLFVVMEEFVGCDLNSAVDITGVFNAKQTSGVISKVALALEYAGNDANGSLVHQNISAPNVFLDELGHVKLTGFGFPNKPQNKQSLPYLAPEILQNASTDYRIDIYALGVLAYYMLSGKMPYAATSTEAMIYEQNGSLSPDINSLVADLPEGLAEFINRALTNNPNERISNWFEIQTLLVSGKGSSLNILANGDMDMALVIQLQTNGVDTSILKQDIHKVMNNYRTKYEMEVVTRENTDVDFAQ